MELQTERWLESFLLLVGLPDNSISEKMEFSHPHYNFYIEYINDNIVFTIGKIIEPAYREKILLKILSKCFPARTKGTLLRPWIAGDYLMLSCTVNTTSSIHHWVYCFKTMQKLLDEVVGIK
ncbi:type III secretion chaperone SycN [Providencia rettgeri]|uniref:type III secretion chaperone SycN n=1 Tax=Providencia rettgeri TaxID=587 RepID=UPI0034E0DFAD